MPFNVKPPRPDPFQFPAGPMLPLPTPPPDEEKEVSAKKKESTKERIRREKALHGQTVHGRN